MVVNVEKNGETDLSNGREGDGSHSKKTLDLFWKLSHAKTEKQVLDASSKMLQSSSKSAVERQSIIKRLMLSLAGSDVGTKNGIFVCLTEMIRQSGLRYSDLQEFIKTTIKTPATSSKSEEANYMLAQLLVISSILRAGIRLEQSQRSEIIDLLVSIGKSRNYLYLPTVKIMIEHFLGDSILLKNVIAKTALKMDSLTMDSLFLFLSIFKMEGSEKFLSEFGVGNKVMGKKSLTYFSQCLLTTNLPPSVLKDHPGFKLFVTSLIEKKAVHNFWQIFSSSMTTANNSGVVGFLLLKEFTGQLETVKNIQGCLTRHVLLLGSHLAVKQAPAEIVKDLFANLIKGCEKNEIDKLDLMKKLLEVDVCWDKLPLGGVINRILLVSDKETVKEVGKIYTRVLREEEKITERVHSSGMLIRMLGMPSVQESLEWRQEILHHLASVSVLSGVAGVKNFNSSGRDQMKDVLFRGLDNRNKSLTDSVMIMLSTVKFISDQQQSGAEFIKTFSTEQTNIFSSALGRILKMEKKWLKFHDNEEGVFIYLYCQMLLQMFAQPDLAVDVLSELDAVNDRRKVTETGQENGEPVWIEVVTEILISLLAQNNHLLRTVVGSVFSVLSKDITQAAMGSLLEVIMKKDDNEKEEDEEGEGEEEEEEEEGDEEVNDDDEEIEDDNSEDSSEDEVEDNSDDEGADSRVNDDVLEEVTKALGDHAATAGEDSESDLEMDDIPDDELARLDEKLVQAFKALGGRKDKHGKRKEKLLKMANMHFQLRVLELVDIYLNHSPNPELLPTIVPSLLQTLDYMIKKGDSKDPLIKRIQSTLGKVSSLKFKKDDCSFSEEFGDAVLESLSGLLELGSNGSVLISNLGPTYPRLVTSFLRLAELCKGKMSELEKLYVSHLDGWLHKSTCVLPTTVFSLAISHNWPGCWSIVSKLSTAAFLPEVRQFRRVATLTLISGLLSNKTFCLTNTEAVSSLVSNIIPSIDAEIAKITAVEKLKPKFLEEMVSILSSTRTFPESHYKDSIGEKLQTLAKAWPKNRVYVNCKKKLLRLLKSWNMKVEFSNALPLKPTPTGNGTNSENSIVTKKKKKKKSQEELKNKKELKLKQAKAQESTDIPSFSGLVEDTLNQDVIETFKRKASDEAVKPQKKKKKNKI